MLERRDRARIWYKSMLSWLAARWRIAVNRVTFRGVVLAAVFVPALIYIYREVTYDALIIDPFTVPKRFEENGLTSEVMSSRIGDALRNIVSTSRTRLSKDSLTSFKDQGSMPDVEIPGTSLGLKTVVDIIRSVFGVYPRHVSGDVVIAGESKAGGSTPSITVTVYVTRGRDRSAPNQVVVQTDAFEPALPLRTAEVILRQINPYLLADYQRVHSEPDKAVEILHDIVKSPSADLSHKSAACDLWGLILDQQRRYDEAAAKYRESIALNPRYAPAYRHWAVVLADQKLYDDAVPKVQKAIELDPKYVLAYNSWGIILHGQHKDDEAALKFQNAIELDPTSAQAYNDWGVMLYDEKRYDDAKVTFEKALDLDPAYAHAYNNLGRVLFHKEQYEEAIRKYQRAIDIDPEYAFAYKDWGEALKAEGKLDEAAEKLAKAHQLAGNQ